MDSTLIPTTPVFLALQDAVSAHLPPTVLSALLSLSQLETEHATAPIRPISPPLTELVIAMLVAISVNLALIPLLVQLVSLHIPRLLITNAFVEPEAS